MTYEQFVEETNVNDTNAISQTTDSEKDQKMSRSLSALTGKTEVAELDAKVGQRQLETGGPKGPEPTRYGDWERNGRCIDF